MSSNLSARLSALLQEDSIPMSDAWGKLFDDLFAIDNARTHPVAWTDTEELRSIEKHGCAYIFKIDPINKFTDPRRQIKLYREPQLIADLVETTKPIKRT